MLLNCGVGKDSVVWTARRANQAILKEINPEYSLEGLMLKLKLQYYGHLMWRMTHWKRPWCWEDCRQDEKGIKEDEMVGWHHHFDGHEFEQTLGDNEGEGSLVCCSPWVLKESDRTERPNTTTNKGNWERFIRVLFHLREIIHLQVTLKRGCKLRSICEKKSHLKEPRKVKMHRLNHGIIWHFPFHTSYYHINTATICYNQNSGLQPKEL